MPTTNIPCATSLIYCAHTHHHSIPPKQLPSRIEDPPSRAGALEHPITDTAIRQHPPTRAHRQHARGGGGARAGKEGRDTREVSTPRLTAYVVNVATMFSVLNHTHARTSASSHTSPYSPGPGCMGRCGEREAGQKGRKERLTHAAPFARRRGSSSLRARRRCRRRRGLRRGAG